MIKFILASLAVVLLASCDLSPDSTASKLLGDTSIINIYDNGLLIGQVIYFNKDRLSQLNKYKSGDELKIDIKCGNRITIQRGE
jgi:hypothetical protein